MQKWFFILIGLFVSAKPLHAQLQLGPIGTWRAHFSNESIGQVIKGDQLYVAAANQIIQVDVLRAFKRNNPRSGESKTTVEQNIPLFERFPIVIR